jgi:putative nucleotidyltransferase with HDIG domain
VTFPFHVESPEKLPTAADRALYAAKNAGRDRLVVGLADPPSAFLQTYSGDPVVNYLEALTDKVEIYQAPVEHGSAIARWAVTMATCLGLDEATQRRCNLAARLHDIGKVATPMHILTKPGALSPEEWVFIHDHPAQGALIVSAAKGLAEVAEIVGQHQERLDGSGYPSGLRGDEIRLEARILSVCDTYASMRADRPYRRGLSEADARTELLSVRGSQLSADLVDLFVDLLDKGTVGHLAHIDPKAVSSPDDAMTL